MLVVACTCGARFKAAAENAGKKAKCPKCGCILIIGASPVSTTESVAHARTPHSVPAPRAAAATVRAPEPEDRLPAVLAASLCPHCGFGMTPGAVLCVGCGYNTKTGKALKGAKPPSAAAVKAGDAARAMGTFLRGILFSCIGAGLGAGLWIFVGLVGDLELGYIAWALGVLAGIGMIVGARDGTFQSGLTAAGIAFAGILAAKIVLVSHFLNEKMHVSLPVGELIQPILKSMFNPFDVIFALLALGTAFRIGSGSRKED